MDFNQWTKLLALFISFLQVMSWPLIFLTLLLFLRNPLRKFIGDIIEVTFKAGPIETTAKRQQVIEVATSLGAATAHWKDKEKKDLQVPDAEKAKEIAQAVNQLLTPGTSRQLAGSSALWV